MSSFKTIGEVLSKTPYANNQKQKKETVMNDTLKNGSDPIAMIREILQQPTPADLVQWKVQAVTALRVSGNGVSSPEPAGE